MLRRIVLDTSTRESICSFLLMLISGSSVNFQCSNLVRFAYYNPKHNDNHLFPVQDDCVFSLRHFGYDIFESVKLILIIFPDR